MHKPTSVGLSRWLTGLCPACEDATYHRSFVRIKCVTQDRRSLRVGQCEHRATRGQDASGDLVHDVDPRVIQGQVARFVETAGTRWRRGRRLRVSGPAVAAERCRPDLPFARGSGGAGPAVPQAARGAVPQRRPAAAASASAISVSVMRSPLDCRSASVGTGSCRRCGRWR